MEPDEARPMKQRSDDSFRLKPTPPRGRDTSSSRSLLWQVVREFDRAGGGIGLLGGCVRGQGDTRSGLG